MFNADSFCLVMLCRCCAKFVYLHNEINEQQNLNGMIQQEFNSSTISNPTSEVKTRVVNVLSKETACNLQFSIKMSRDIVIPIFGDSMSPKHPSGSLVKIRHIPMWRDYLEFGETYVLELIDGRRIIKNVRKSSVDDCFLLESVNPKYEPTDIPKRMIRNVFRVIMSASRETL